MLRRFAVILAGCGNKDGAEIHEAVLTLLAIDQTQNSYQCFAPNIAQTRTLNFLTNEPMPQERNVLIEAARIARSQIKDLFEFNPNDFDILVLVGGSGVAYNLCTYAQESINMSINEDVKKAVLCMHAAGKPIGALCIAPVIIAKLIPDACVTFGADTHLNTLFGTIGTRTLNANPTEIAVDKINKIVSTPCYMINDARISSIAVGIKRLVDALLEMST